MTPGASFPLDVDRLTLTIYGAETSMDMLSTVAQLYAEIYAEPPYDEGPADVAEFTSGWSQRGVFRFGLVCRIPAGRVINKRHTSRHFLAPTADVPTENENSKRTVGRDQLTTPDTYSRVTTSARGSGHAPSLRGLGLPRCSAATLRTTTAR